MFSFSFFITHAKQNSLSTPNQIRMNVSETMIVMKKFEHGREELTEIFSQDNGNDGNDGNKITELKKHVIILMMSKNLENNFS